MRDALLYTVIIYLKLTRGGEGRGVAKEGVGREVGEGKVEEVKEETKRRGWWPW